MQTLKYVGIALFAMLCVVPCFAQSQNPADAAQQKTNFFIPDNSR